MDIVLAAGIFMPVTIWDAVADRLRALGHRPLPVRLPGQGAEPVDATLEDQLDAVLAAIDRAERPLVVGHSAASTLAWLAADRRADAIAGAVLIGGFPATEGEAYAAFFPIEEGVMPFPGWGPFEGPDSDDLSTAQKEQIAADSIPVPVGVATATASYVDPARHDVPVWEICPEYSPADARAWIDNGDVPELASARSLELVDLDSGHWPMVSCPEPLADLLAGIADAAAAAVNRA